MRARNSNILEPITAMVSDGGPIVLRNEGMNTFLQECESKRYGGVGETLLSLLITYIMSDVLLANSEAAAIRALKMFKVTNGNGVLDTIDSNDDHMEVVLIDSKDYNYLERETIAANSVANPPKVMADELGDFVTNLVARAMELIAPHVHLLNSSERVVGKYLMSCGLIPDMSYSPEGVKVVFRCLRN